MATGALGLTLPALRLKPGIEFIKARRLRDRLPKKFNRACLTSPATLPPESIGSFPLPGRPKRSANRRSQMFADCVNLPAWLTSSVNARVRSRLPSPQIFATAIVVLV